jgi:hypothetical protein
MYWSIVIASAAVGLAAVAALLWFGWWRFPKRQVDRLRLTIRDPKARADIEDNLRKTIGQLIGGTMVLIGAGLGAVIAYLQLSQQQQASRDLLISNQVAKGFEQLGSDKVVVRLGGIYALEGVMNTSVPYGQPVLEALSAFVRDSTRTATGDGPPATDVQAALTVIARRTGVGTGSPNLANAHIPKVFLPGANLFTANLDHADLTGAFLIGANLGAASLSYTNLTGAFLLEANLTGAFLLDAHLNNADLRGGKIRQKQLDLACGTGVKLGSGLTIKPCP